MLIMLSEKTGTQNNIYKSKNVFLNDWNGCAKSRWFGYKCFLNFSVSSLLKISPKCYYFYHRNKTVAPKGGNGDRPNRSFGP